MPIPVSLTEISTAPSVCLALIPIRPPSGVNFTALESRLSRICLIFLSSPTKSPSRSSTVTSSSHFSRRDYIEGCNRREYFHLDDPGGISIIVTATDSQLDADGCDSALHEPMPDSQALLFPRCRFGR